MVVTILVVDDDPYIREVISVVLSDEGYTVYQANDGQRALERLETMPTEPDLVLSDVKMPRLSGFELAERLTHRRRPIPIVLMSANCVAPQGWGRRFLAKPFSLEDLLALVAQNLETDGRSDGERGRHLAVAL